MWLAGECQNWFSSYDGFRDFCWDSCTVLTPRVQLLCFFKCWWCTEWKHWEWRIFHRELSLGIVSCNTAFLVTGTEGTWAISMLSCVLVAAGMGKQVCVSAQGELQQAQGKQTARWLVLCSMDMSDQDCASVIKREVHRCAAGKIAKGRGLVVS